MENNVFERKSRYIMMSGSGFCWWRRLCGSARQLDAVRAPRCKLHIWVCGNSCKVALVSYLCCQDSEAAGKQTCSTAAQAQPEPEAVIFSTLREKMHSNGVRSRTRTKHAGLCRTAEGRNIIASSRLETAVMTVRNPSSEMSVKT